MSFKTIHLAIVDDQTLFRKTLKNYLVEHDGLSVVIHVPDIFELFSKMQHFKIDVLIIDAFMPGIKGCDAIKMIREKYPHIRILVLSMNKNLDFISDMMESGINGYISKTDDPEELIQAIKAADEDKIFRNKIFTDALYWNKQRVKKFQTGRDIIFLTEREKKILQLIWEEKNNQEIGDELFLGSRSIEKIKLDIKEKIGAKSTVGLIKYAIDHKIIYTSHRSENANCHE
jgi:DNA-binding NarL/FixJ family response regulator